MRSALFTVIACVLLVSVALGEDRAAPPASQPVDAARVQELIHQLGDEDFAVREQASAKLKELGPAVLPALKEAQDSQDPEVKARATQVARAIEGKDKPVAVNPDPASRRPIRGGFQLQGGGGIMVGNVRAMSVTSSSSPGKRTVTATEDDRTVNIVETDADGIDITVTDNVDGKAVTKQYKAKTADELKKDSPEGFELYEKYMKPQRQPIRLQLRMQGGQVEIQPQPEE